MSTENNDGKVWFDGPRENPQDGKVVAFTDAEAGSRGCEPSNVKMREFADDSDVAERLKAFAKIEEETDKAHRQKKDD